MKQLQTNLFWLICTLYSGQYAAHYTVVHCTLSSEGNSEVTTWPAKGSCLRERTVHCTNRTLYILPQLNILNIHHRTVPLSNRYIYKLLLHNNSTYELNVRKMSNTYKICKYTVRHTDIIILQHNFWLALLSSRGGRDAKTYECVNNVCVIFFQDWLKYVLCFVEKVCIAGILCFWGITLGCQFVSW